MTALALLLVLVPSVVSAAPPGQEGQTYTVQKDDSLWTIAEKYLGNGTAYYAIVAATNAKHEEDATFAEIANASLIQPGWKVFVPSAEEAETYIALAQPKYGGTLVVCTTVEPLSLIAIIDPGKGGNNILNNTMDGLLNRTPDYSQVYPYLAKDWPETPDPLTYIFHLQEGVKFHNGREVTSEDIKYTYTRLIDESYGASFGGEYRKHIESIETPDKYTVIFHMKEEWPIFLAFAGGNHPKVCNKDLAELPEYGTSVWSGTGPFMIKEWVMGEYVRVVRNPDFWGAGEIEWMKGTPYLDEVIIKPIADTTAAYAALEAGQCDALTEPEYKDVKRFADDPKYVVMSKPDPAELLLTFDTTEPPFSDKRVRQAISKGIDRQEIVDVIFYGYAEVAGGFFPSFHWAHDPSVTVPYDPEGAKALLKEAGYDESNPLNFTLLSNTDPVHVDVMVLIQEQLKRIGVEMEAVPVEQTTLVGIVRGPKDAWEAGLDRITPLRGMAVEYTYYQYGAEGPLNTDGYNQPGGYQNPDFEAKLLKANSYSDYDPAQREEAKPLYRELSLITIEDAPRLRLLWKGDVDVMHSYVKGWVQAVSNRQLWQLIWLDK
jgi:peptide/nickel transport system substrate-binding protein